eukprot:184825-Prymnesium_polylepis.1
MRQSTCPRARPENNCRLAFPQASAQPVEQTHTTLPLPNRPAATESGKADRTTCLLTSCAASPPRQTRPRCSDARARAAPRRSASRRTRRRGRRGATARSRRR